MKEYSFKTFWSEEDKSWVSVCQQMKGVSTFGDSPESSMNEMSIAMKGVLEVIKEDNKPQ